ncbi:SRPBCC family protein [Flavivirga aquimarina]|uniref:SRPBCC family protein n=1 Tax=Flavivirga aquimarina TaxID=2027862 RepID=A0ABT8WAZ2_9FLAO|nr:SRPBCC family protein [Flavivirga aquimarina]MDO5970276.1 SRPBCC family protein [Flavivirga aquimarina]
MNLKKMQVIDLTKTINASTDSLWNIMVTNFGNVANYTPTLYFSRYANELREVAGCERHCTLSSNGKKYLVERLDFVDKKNHTYRVKFKESSEPIDKELSFVQFTLTPINTSTTKIKTHMEYRTKPAFIGFLAKRQFIKIFRDMFIGLEHYEKSGEKINASIGNFKKIKKNYQY